MDSAMSDKLKVSAGIVVAIIAVLILVMSAYRSLQPPPQTTPLKQSQYIQKLSPEQIRRLPPYEQRRIEKIREQSK